MLNLAMLVCNHQRLAPLDFNDLRPGLGEVGGEGGAITDVRTADRFQMSIVWIKLDASIHSAVKYQPDARIS